MEQGDPRQPLRPLWCRDGRRRRSYVVATSTSPGDEVIGIETDCRVMVELLEGDHFGVLGLDPLDETVSFLVVNRL